MQIESFAGLSIGPGGGETMPPKVKQQPETQQTFIKN